MQDNDFVFVEEIIADISNEYNVDTEAIYAIGTSNGGMMPIRKVWRCRRGNPEGGGWNRFCDDVDRHLRSNTYRSIIHFHGSADNIVPMDGNQDFAAVTAGIDTGRRTTSRPYWQPLLNNGSVTRTVYSGGTEDTSVVLYTIQNGRHVWFNDHRWAKKPTFMGLPVSIKTML